MVEHTYKTYLSNIYNLQIRMLKTIVPLKIKHKYKHNYESLFNHCKVLSIFDKVDLEILAQYRDKIDKLIQVSRHSNLRTLENLPSFVVPRSRNNYGQRAWSCILPCICNKFPKQLLLELSNKKAKSFRKSIKLYLLKKRSGYVM
jgi:hypothetical protein